METYVLKRILISEDFEEDRDFSYRDRDMAVEFPVVVHRFRVDTKFSCYTTNFDD